MEVVPSVFLSFFAFGDESDTNDEQLITQIDNFRDTLTQTKYRSRLAVVLVGDTTIANDQNLDDRLSTLRKALKLDNKSTFFYIPADLSTEELAPIAESILTAIRPASLDFYRESTKQVRRKRDKGALSTSQVAEQAQLHVLPTSAWTARYEYKLGFLAEVRADMSIAIGHYNAALDALFDIGGVFYTLSNWSPHWNAARLFADAIAIHQLRCLLANGMPSDTVRFWVKYYETLQQVLDTKGKGTTNYSWKAWQARWARIMAELIQDSPAHPVDVNARKAIEDIFKTSNSPHVYAPMEGPPSEEPYNPWDLMHHPGYWLVMSANFVGARRNLALAIPEADRVPPGQSPSSRVAKRNEIYDTYLCPQPHDEYALTTSDDLYYTKQIVSTYVEAADEFTHRAQPSMASRIRLFTAREYTYAEQWQDTLEVTRSLWPGHDWRRSGWWNGVGEVALLLYRSGKELGDRPSQVRALWELMSKRFRTYEDITYDLMTLMKPKGESETTSSAEQDILLRHEDIVSFLSIAFAFAADESHASETVQAQMTIISTAHPTSSPVDLDSVKLDLEGQVKNIEITHEDPSSTGVSSDGAHVATLVPLKTALMTNTKQAHLSGVANLTIQPGQTKVFTFSINLREAGNLRAVRAFATIKTSTMSLQYSQSLSTSKALTHWWLQDAKLPRQRQAYHKPDTLRVQPKLPKVLVNFVGKRDVYYTDESFQLNVEIINQEVADVVLMLEVTMPGHEDQMFQVQRNALQEGNTGAASTSGPKPIEFGTIPAGTAQQVIITTQLPSEAADLAIDVKANYHLITEPGSPLTKSTSTTINIVAPFDIDYSLRPDLHPESWPKFFSQQIGREDGIINRWTLTSAILSQANEKLRIERVELQIDTVSEGAGCVVLDTDVATETDLVPSAQHDLAFRFDTRKALLEDLRALTVEASLKIKWHRASPTTSGPPTSITTILPAPTFRLPTTEPRALASLSPSPATDPNLIILDLVLENPSMHFLSFQISLDPNDDFAFSGDKIKMLNLVPMSRRSLRYVLSPWVKGAWIKPVLRVVDSHYDKVLSVHATGGVQRHEGTLRVWVEAA